MDRAGDPESNASKSARQKLSRHGKAGQLDGAATRSVCWRQLRRPELIGTPITIADQMEE
jgi:hypothetical protein